ncbi:hypothetical protein HED60_20645 [Planctomycetales bacterium ZRK34]|nr:hypothetical protein HED60_20645 [Planctomycetales bacterium ZRK34]
MPVARHFLKPDAHALPQAADWLLQQFGPDQAAVTVVLPGRRAGRRLLELLVEAAQHAGRLLIPPRITTVGSLLDQLCVIDQPAADAVARQQAWIAALQDTPADQLAEFLPAPPPVDQLAAWAAVADQLDQLHETIAANGHDFAVVAERGESIPDFTDELRWAALADVQHRYFAALQSAGIVDPHHARIAAVESNQLAAAGPIVLLAVVDLSTLHRRVLQQLDVSVTALVHADESDADRFDDLGCLRIERWEHAVVPLDDRQVELVERPTDQADAVVRTIDGYQGSYPPEQITVGVCDDRVQPYLIQRLRAFGLPVRAAAGLDMARTRPVRLLKIIADWLDRRLFTDFATLLRHPDIEDHLRRALVNPAIESWLTLMDRYLSDHLQGRLSSDWLGDDAQRAQLKRISDAVEALIEPLIDESPRPLSQWAQPIADTLCAVYAHRPLNRFDEADRLVVETCDRLRGLLDAMIDLPAGLDRPVRATAALRLLVKHAERLAAVPPDPSDADAAIELLGPLELHLDDADALVITGFNEGFMPSSINADAFLPDALRSRLDLPDNRRRYARDAYALSAMLRSGRRVKLVTGRITTEGDPLTPSRLLFACEDDEVPARVKRFYEPRAEPPAIFPPSGELSGGITPFVVPPPPRPLTKPITKLPVTAFRHYLECPYRFYLRYALGLKPLDDQATEMDGGTFGTLAHDVLGAFAHSEAATSVQADTIQAMLNQTLDHVSRRKFGDDPLPAVRVQIEQLRQRLAGFAQWQAGWAGKGWRIATDQVEQRLTIGFDVDGEPMQLVGRIDRIDVNETTGACVVFDYKTSDRGDGPDITHSKRGEWTDLQLPLYRHLVRAAGITSEVQLGYILLPRDRKRITHELAPWSAGDLDIADEEARRVIRAVRAEQFWPPSDPPAFDDYAAICGVEQLLGFDTEDES